MIGFSEMTNIWYYKQLKIERIKLNNLNQKENYSECTVCRWENQCRHKSSAHINDCNYIVPIDTNIVVPEWITNLKALNIPTKNHKLVGVYTMGQPTAPYDIVSSNYEYYRWFINDSLSQIRQGYSAILFFDYQVEEMLRFEPDIYICEYDNMIYTWLPILEKRFKKAGVDISKSLVLHSLRNGEIQ